MEKIHFEIYKKLHAEGVARMWSESREGWPPGFLGASEHTAESVEMTENSSGKLFTVLAIDGDRVVGYCRTTPYGGEPDAAYVALLNVVTDLHGKKLGKKLLLDAVRRTADDGYYRIDLHTWPANLKAMPLYKKTGFFWVPDSMVYMQNYMPFLLGRAEFRDFLGNTDWYDCFIRELEVEPDEQRTETGREVFNYLFRIGDDSFKAEFDRRGRILSFLETPLLSVSVRRNREKIFYGKAVSVSIEGNSLPKELSIESHKYLTAPESLTVREASEGFDVIPEPVEVPIPDRDRSPRVSIVLPGDDPLSIGIGIRAEEPVLILSSPVRRLSPGQEELALDIKKLVGSDSFRLEARLGGEVFLNETY
ncbi:MAG: GNAT family N-acetyltransferase, partial [Candidatus Aegiribacteria sp.]|nr:GNAT family N-acetyltransferase [Candidatus Aegiribacteria sp.]